MGRQALKLANGRDACAWSPTEINAACEALSTLLPNTLEAVGDEGLTGLVIMLGLALRRAAPGAPGISDAQRTAYASLHPKLAVILVDIDRAVTEHKLSSGTALELCTALIKTHTLRAFCPLLAAASSALLPPPAGPPRPRPPRRLVLSSLVLLQEASNMLGTMIDFSERYALPDARRPVLSLLETELSESGLLEHWSRLALALGGYEGVDEGAAKAVASVGAALSIMLKMKREDENNFEESWDFWSHLLLSGSSPSLVYLLSSHLVALAAELDGGPTYSLPAALEEEGAAAGPSSSAPATAPKARPPIPLLNASGVLLKPAQYLDTPLTYTVLDLQKKSLEVVVHTAIGVMKAQPTVYGPEGAALTNQALVTRTCALRLRDLGAEIAHVESAGEGSWDRDGKWHAIAVSHKEECAKVLAALRRRETFADVAAGYQLGMRLARAAALSLQGYPGLTAASCGASGEGAWEALVAAHDPSGWQDPASPPLPPLGSAAAVRLAPKDAVQVAWRCLVMARDALRPARDMCDKHGPEATPPWFKQQLGSYWRAAVAWAGLLWREGPHAQPAPIMGCAPSLRLLYLYKSARGESVSVDTLHALPAGYLGAFEALIRYSPGQPEPLPDFYDAAPYRYLLTHSRAADVASLAGTVAKLLRRHPSPGDDLQRIVALTRCFGLVTGKDQGFGQQSRRHYSTLQPSGPSGAVPAVGSGSASAATTSGGASGAAAGEAPSFGAASGTGIGVVPDLPLSAACIALQLLPEAARVGRALAEAVPPRLSAPAPPPDLRPLEDLVALLLDWMPPLVLAARPLELMMATGEGAGPRAGAESREAAAAATPAQAARPLDWEGEGAGAGAAAESEAAEASPPQALSAAQAWDDFLWNEVDPAWILGTALRFATESSPLCASIKHAFWALAVRDPGRLRELAMPAETRASRSAEAGVPATTPPGSIVSRLAELLGWDDGASRRDEDLRIMVAHVLNTPDIPAMFRAQDFASWSPGLAQFYASAVSVLASPAEVRRALPGCSNPACTNLAGPSEGALRLRRCGGCGGAARYCGLDCQAVHWAAGHARECRVLAAAANGRGG